MTDADGFFTVVRGGAVYSASVWPCVLVWTALLVARFARTHTRPPDWPLQRGRFSRLGLVTLVLVVALHPLLLSAITNAQSYTYWGPRISSFAPLLIAQLIALVLWGSTVVSALWNAPRQSLWRQKREVRWAWVAALGLTIPALVQIDALVIGRLPTVVHGGIDAAALGSKATLVSDVGGPHSFFWTPADPLEVDATSAGSQTLRLRAAGLFMEIERAVTFRVGTPGGGGPMEIGEGDHWRYMCSETSRTQVLFVVPQQSTEAWAVTLDVQHAEEANGLQVFPIVVENSRHPRKRPPTAERRVTRYAYGLDGETRYVGHTDSSPLYGSGRFAILNGQCAPPISVDAGPVAPPTCTYAGPKPESLVVAVSLLALSVPLPSAGACHLQTAKAGPQTGQRLD